MVRFSHPTLAVPDALRPDDVFLNPVIVSGDSEANGEVDWIELARRDGSDASGSESGKLDQASFFADLFTPWSLQGVFASSHRVQRRFGNPVSGERQSAVRSPKRVLAGVSRSVGLESKLRVQWDG